MKVRLARKAPPSLTLEKEYMVLGIECDAYRFLDDDGDPCVFDPDLFEIVDDIEPTEWISEIIDGVRYAYPPELASRYFWEDYHDRDHDTVEAFRKYLRRHPELFE